ncbi:MAG: response regulator [Desulfobacterales bacterium]|nr:response regulator [Desulfobacterales bacterium]
MVENSPIQLQVSQIASSLGANIKNCHHTLEELRRLSLILFTHTRADNKQIKDWFAAEDFNIDEDGFWTSISLLRAFRQNQAPPDAISYSWHPNLVNDQDACFRMYCLRIMGPYLLEISNRLPDAAWIYYQDVTNTSIQFPYIDQKTAITPDFDWSAYHTYVSVAPENNPERHIKWTTPTIDYAGEGLIISVSIPVYMSNRFIGLWSIDLPLKNLYKEIVFEAYLKGQINFIIDREGFLVSHPFVETKIDKEKGSFYRGHLHDLGDRYKTLDPERLIAERSGKCMLAGGEKDETVIWFETIPGIQWIFLATLPRQSMEDAVNKRIRKALDQVKSGDLSYRIKGVSDIDQARLVAEGFNQMVSALELQEKTRKEAQDEKEKLEKRLQHFQRMEAIGTLAGGIAHDFNNILFPILGYSELLFQDLKKESHEYDMVNQIYRAAIRASELTRQILTFSRQTETENQVVSFQSIVKEALKLLRASIPKNIEIVKNISSDCPAVLGDPTKLHQIIMNLCTNAYHAVEETGGKFEITMTPVNITVEPPPGLENLTPGPYVRLSVSDNGYGMDSRTLMRIFDPYFTTKTNGKGTGLGLAVIYGIVRQLKGDIKAYSEPRKGSTFHVYLPGAENRSKTEKKTETAIIGGTEHILLVDDETSIASMGKQFLERYGYRVTAFSDSERALEIFSKSPHEFDLVITDMTMPNMTGDVLAEKIKKIRKDIPVILCTGFSEKVSSTNYQTGAIDSFFMKPISIADIDHAIRRMLDINKQKKPSDTVLYE